MIAKEEMSSAHNGTRGISSTISQSDCFPLELYSLIVFTVKKRVSAVIIISNSLVFDCCLTRIEKDSAGGICRQKHTANPIK